MSAVDDTAANYLSDKIAEGLTLVISNMLSKKRQVTQFGYRGYLFTVQKIREQG